MREAMEQWARTADKLAKDARNRNGIANELAKDGVDADGEEDACLYQQAADLCAEVAVALLRFAKANPSSQHSFEAIGKIDQLARSSNIFANLAGLRDSEF